jgi:hypothetical protein
MIAAFGGTLNPFQAKKLTIKVIKAHKRELIKDEF